MTVVARVRGNDSSWSLSGAEGRGDWGPSVDADPDMPQIGCEHYLANKRRVFEIGTVCHPSQPNNCTPFPQL